MPTVKISELTAIGATPDATDQLIINDGVVTKSITVSNLHSGLQSQIDAKQDASTALTTSNYATTLDTRYYTESEIGTFLDGTTPITGYNKSNWDTAYGWGDHSVEGYLTSNQTITLSGDVSGSGTTSIIVTVADDSHNHIISNVDGLQAALDSKYEDGSTLSVGNITTTGYLRGPSNFVIDPATHGDDTGTLVIAGNLQVDGTTTTINSTIVTVDDKNLVLASGAADASAANGAGITIDGASATLTYNGVDDQWELNKTLEITGSLTFGTLSVSAILDEDDMTSDSATALATQQSIKAYVDANAGADAAVAFAIALG